MLRRRNIPFCHLTGANDLSMMVCLGFPEQLVRWVMMCVTTVSYSIVVNGELLPPSRPVKD